MPQTHHTIRDCSKLYLIGLYLMLRLRSGSSHYELPKLPSCDIRWPAVGSPARTYTEQRVLTRVCLPATAYQRGCGQAEVGRQSSVA